MLQPELATAQPNWDFQLVFAVTQDGNRHFLIGSSVTCQVCDQVVHSLDGRLVNGSDDIRAKSNKLVIQVEHPRDFTQACL